MQSSSQPAHANRSTESSGAAASQGAGAGSDRTNTAALLSRARTLDPSRQPGFAEQASTLAPPPPQAQIGANAGAGIRAGASVGGVAGVVAADTNDDTLEELMAKPRLTAVEIARARRLIAALPRNEQPAFYTALQEKSAYFSQRDVASRGRANRGETNASQDNLCNLTSLAMCFEQLGIPNPGTLDGRSYPQYEDYLEALRIKHNLGDRTVGGTFTAIGRHMTPRVRVTDLGVSGRVMRGVWRTRVGSVLSSGSSVMMSITGHIVRVQSVTADGLIIDDPYGVVNLNTPTVGRNGRQRHTWSYDRGNRNDAGVAETQEGGRKGEDNLWVWSEVERHSMLWARGFSIG